MLFFFFFFKQKTAYEMRISDWSSDVCSSDLPDVPAGSGLPGVVDEGIAAIDVHGRDDVVLCVRHGRGDCQACQDRRQRNGRVGRSHVYLLLPASLPAGVTQSSRTAIVSIRATSPAGTHVMRRVDGSQPLQPRALRSVRYWSRMGPPGRGPAGWRRTTGGGGGPT